MGIEQSLGDLILLLNSDTILREDSISKAVSFYKEQDNAGVAGCRMTYPDGQVQYTARRFRSIGWELLDLFRFIPYLLPYEKRAGEMLGKYFRHDRDIECDWLNGAFFLFKKDILGQLPGKKLDDRFFMYGEDQLWCEQIKSLGYRNIFYAGTTIIHISSGSTDLKKQLSLRTKMMKNELEIMKLRKGRGLYYCFFALVYCTKEYIRNFIKWLVIKTTGRSLR
jgi:GT2 family glycosyltransferase